MATFVFKKAIPRRTVLKGMGSVVALPVLDGMVPAFGKATATDTPTRLGIVFTGNGMWPMDKWTPQTEGADFKLSPTMEPLAPFRDQLLVVSGLASKEGLPKADDPTNEHQRASTTFLTGVRPRQIGGEAHAGISMDQLAAAKLGRGTQLSSLEVSLMANHELVGSCDNNTSCVFVDTLCWRSPTAPLPMETNPRSLFERLFGDVNSTNRAEQVARMHQQRSILDGMLEQVSAILKVTGPKDRAKLNEYLEAVRESERRIQIAEAQPDHELPHMDRPVGVPVSFKEYAKLMMDLLVLAYQADLTRVITFMLNREGTVGGLSYPQIGIPEGHHSLSHHQNDPVKVDKLFRINVYNTQLFGYFLQKLKETVDGDGALLDRVMLLYGSSLSNGNGHQYTNLPLLIAGGGNGRIKGNRHIRYPDNTPITNLHLALLDKLAIPVEHLGDSTGRLNLLSL